MAMKGVLHIPQISKVGALTADGLSYQDTRREGES